MARNRIFMNEPRPGDEFERRQLERFNRLMGVRPLDGTNLEWIYHRCPQCGGEMRVGQLGNECSQCGLRGNASRPVWPL